MNFIRYIICIIFLNTCLFGFAQNTKVARVIDGDTFETTSGEKVRLIGINAPEISDIFGVESKEYLSKLILDKEIILVTDNLSNNTDRYGRSIRYVNLKGTDINKLMISDGYAIAYLKYRFEKSDDYKQEQLNSMKLNRGMWNNSNKSSVQIAKSDVIKPNIQYWNIKVIFISIILLILILVGLFFYFKKD